MRKIALSLAVLVATVLAMSSTAPTHAQGTNAVSFVASNGSGSTCTQAAPCLTFAAAVAATQSGGEVTCLTSGSFGAISITYPITID